jgi:hypothetical protein
MTIETAGDFSSISISRSAGSAKVLSQNRANAMLAETVSLEGALSEPSAPHKRLYQPG